MNGIEATRKIKEVSPATKVVIMTAHDDERLLVEAVEAGASGFLGKDEAAEEVLAAAKAAADGEVLIDPTILTRLLHQVAIEREARSSAQALLDDLTDREREILQLLAEGMRNDDIATQAVHQPPDRADARPQHPGQASGALQARGRRLRRQARRHRRLTPAPARSRRSFTRRWVCTAAPFGPKPAREALPGPATAPQTAGWTGRDEGGALDEQDAKDARHAAGAGRGGNPGGRGDVLGVCSHHRQHGQHLRGRHGLPRRQRRRLGHVQRDQPEAR